jgi:hypothetical protein
VRALAHVLAHGRKVPPALWPDGEFR